MKEFMFRLGTMIGFYFLLLLNILLIPYFIVVYVIFKKKHWPVIFPKSLKARLAMYQKVWGEEVEKFIYKQD